VSAQLGRLPRYMGILRMRALMLIGLCLLAGCRHAPLQSPEVRASDAAWRQQNHIWRGVHLFVQNDSAVEGLIEAMPKYASAGVNVFVIEVNYSFEFESHPELRAKNYVTLAQARRLAEAARRQGIRLIPELDCLSHQSWQHRNLPLLDRHPDWMEPLDESTDKEGAALHCWCPLHPSVNPVVFQLIDELAGAFGATAFHVGMDEAFCIASPLCPRCRGRDPARVFAKAVTDLHGHIVGRRKMEMLMWGDRLLDSKALGYSKWEASRNGTAGAIDLIPKDIIICDWHYEKQETYPSVGLLLEKGLRVWPSGWQPLDASRAFSRFARKQRNPGVLGYLCTTWGKANTRTAADWPPVLEVLQEWKP